MSSDLANSRSNQERPFSRTYTEKSQPYCSFLCCDAEFSRRIVEKVHNKRIAQVNVPSKGFLIIFPVNQVKSKPLKYVISQADISSREIFSESMKIKDLEPDLRAQPSKIASKIHSYRIWDESDFYQASI